MNYIDLHCHALFKPYGKSISIQNGTIHQAPNSADYNNVCSIWHPDPPKSSESDYFFDDVIGNSPYRQSDFKTATNGNVKILVVSIDPPEKHFFDGLPVGLANWVTNFGRPRIEQLLHHTPDYFADMVNKYNFLKELDDTHIEISGIKYKYKICNSYSDAKAFINTPGTSNRNKLAVFLTIEGAHALSDAFALGHKLTEDDFAEIKQNIATLKTWAHQPLYVSLAHHFDNGLSGHCESLNTIKPFNIPLYHTKQMYAINDDINTYGLEVIDLLLQPDANGRRIYTDVKHFSRKNRTQYYNLINTYKNNGVKIPVIMSHGAVRGKQGNTIFFDDEINFDDDELVLIQETNGIFGIQIDEKRIASHSEISKAKAEVKTYPKNDRENQYAIRYAKLFFKQVTYIGELLDSKGLPAWDIQCLGSDFDGIVNSLNGYRTSANISRLFNMLVPLALDYFNDNPNWNLSSNLIDGRELVKKVLHHNADAFLKRWY